MGGDVDALRKESGSEATEVAGKVRSIRTRLGDTAQRRTSRPAGVTPRCPSRMWKVARRRRRGDARGIGIIISGEPAWLGRCCSRVEASSHALWGELRRNEMRSQ